MSLRRVREATTIAGTMPGASPSITAALPAHGMLLLGQSRLPNRTLTEFTSDHHDLFVWVQTRAPNIPGRSNFDTKIGIHQEGSRWDSPLLGLFESVGWLVDS
jgi:hypothetical protein